MSEIIVKPSSILFLGLFCVTHHWNTAAGFLLFVVFGLILFCFVFLFFCFFHILVHMSHHIILYVCFSARNIRISFFVAWQFSSHLMAKILETISKITFIFKHFHHFFTHFLRNYPNVPTRCMAYFKTTLATPFRTFTLSEKLHVALPIIAAFLKRGTFNHLFATRMCFLSTKLYWPSAWCPWRFLSPSWQRLNLSVITL